LGAVGLLGLVENAFTPSPPRRPKKVVVVEKRVVINIESAKP
jgi:hypothetical protein